MENTSTELIGLGIAVLIYLVRSWLVKKNADLDKKAEQIQNIILSAITQARSIPKEGRDAKISLDLKQVAIDAVVQEISTNPKITSVMSELNIPLSPEKIGEYIEIGLHAAKLGLNNVLKDRFKRLK